MIWLRDLVEHSTARLLARRRPDWLEAMMAEGALLPDDGAERLRWALGCWRAALLIRARDCDLLHLAAVVAAAAAIVVCDWLGDSDRTTLTSLVAAAAAAAFARPERMRRSAIWLGFCLLAAHGLSDRTGLWWPPYQFAPLGLGDWLILASVSVLAFAAALAGARLRRGPDVRRFKSAGSPDS